MGFGPLLVFKGTRTTGAPPPLDLVKLHLSVRKEWIASFLRPRVYLQLVFACFWVRGAISGVLPMGIQRANAKVACAPIINLTRRSENGDFARVVTRAREMMYFNRARRSETRPAVPPIAVLCTFSPILKVHLPKQMFVSGSVYLQNRASQRAFSSGRKKRKPYGNL